MFTASPLNQGMMVPQKYRFTAENAEGAEVTYLLHKGFSATSAISAVEKAFFATLSKYHNCRFEVIPSPDIIFEEVIFSPFQNGGAK
jgi:hypothetical protein